MKKIIAIPDSYSEIARSSGICRIMEQTIHQYYPDCQVLTIPVADGGEGSVECFLTAMGGELVKEKVAGPYFEEMEGFYGLIDGGSTAVIEMAACAGLPLVRGNKNAAKTTTYGVGQLLLAAAPAAGGQKDHRRPGRQQHQRRRLRHGGGLRGEILPRGRRGLHPGGRHPGRDRQNRRQRPGSLPEGRGDRHHVRYRQPPLRRKRRRLYLRPPEGRG